MNVIGIYLTYTNKPPAPANRIDARSHRRYPSGMNKRLSLEVVILLICVVASVVFWIIFPKGPIYILGGFLNLGMFVPGLLILFAPIVSGLIGLYGIWRWRAAQSESELIKRRWSIGFIALSLFLALVLSIVRIYLSGNPFLVKG